MGAVKQSFVVPGDDFTRAGEASAKFKGVLKQLGFAPNLIRSISVAMYEGEINMVIHADGGTVNTLIDADCITIILKDTGPGIEDVDLAMQEGYSTAPDDIRALGFGAGMGLPNIKKYADDMDIQTKVGAGTTLTLKFYTNKH